MSVPPVVVDASALLNAWLPREPHQEAADALLWDMRQGNIEPHAPHLLAYELLNGVYRGARGKAGQSPRIPMEQVDTIWMDLDQLRVTLHDTRALTPRIIELARTFDRPAIYDVTYLALAESLKATFVTADAKLCHALGGQLSWVVPLARYGTRL